MAVRDELHALVDRLTEDDIEEVLDYVQWILRPEDSLSEQQMARVRHGEDEIARGEVIPLADLDRPRE